MNRSFSRLVGVVSLLGPLSVATPALAEDVEAATTLFNRGLSDMEAGWYTTACPALAESQRLDPRPGRLFTLSQCEVRWGRVATAVTRLAEYLQLYEHLPPDQKAKQEERSKVAKDQLSKLTPEVPELTLSLPPGAPAGTLVKRDDAVVAGAALGVSLPVDPGEHVVSTQAPGGTVWELRFTLARGEKRPLMLEVKAAPTAPARPAPPPAVVAATPDPAKQSAPPPQTKAGPSGRRVAVYAIGGLGVAGLALGGVMGGLALGKKSTIESNCGDAVHMAPTFCNQTGVDAGKSIKPLGLASTIGFAAGLAGVTAAVVLLVTEPSAAKPTTGAHGRWISPEVISLAPTGATLGAHGSF
jgi:hypothetical protein